MSVQANGATADPACHYSGVIARQPEQDSKQPTGQPRHRVVTRLAGVPLREHFRRAISLHLQYVIGRLGAQSRNNDRIAGAQSNS